MVFPSWAHSIDAAITVCDKNATIIYMNDKAESTFANYGGRGLIGKSLLDCHNPQSQRTIQKLLQEGGSQVYSIEKDQISKLIYQSAWKTDDKVGGLVEISIVLPADMPHHIRG